MSTMPKTYLEGKLEAKVLAERLANPGKTIKHSPTHWEHVYKDGNREFRVSFNPKQKVAVAIEP